MIDRNRDISLYSSFQLVQCYTNTTEHPHPLTPTIEGLASEQQQQATQRHRSAAMWRELTRLFLHAYTHTSVEHTEHKLPLTPKPYHFICPSMFSYFSSLIVLFIHTIVYSSTAAYGYVIRLSYVING